MPRFPLPRPPWLAGLLTSLALLSAAPASAQTVTFTSGSFPSGTPFDIRFTGTLLGPGNSPYDLPAPWAGQMILQTADGGSFLAWCVDLFHELNVNAIGPGNTHTYTVAALQTDSSGVDAAHSNPLTTQQVHDVLALAQYGNEQLALLPTGFEHDLVSGAVQVAIWDTIYDGEIDFEVLGSAVNGVTPQDFTDRVNTLRALAPSLGTGTALGMVSLDSSGRFQTQGLVGNFTPLSAPVPEPHTLALMSLGLLVVWRRRATPRTATGPR